MTRTHAAAAVYATFAVVFWAVALPALVLVGERGGPAPVWRPFPLPLLAVAMVGAGAGLVWAGGRTLAAAGVGLFGTTPGPGLVADGLYGLLRHPMDAGAVVISAAPALALSLRQVWVVPVAALAYFAVAFEPFEERRLHETFGEGYEEYRARVPRWFPKG